MNAGTPSPAAPVSGSPSSARHFLLLDGLRGIAAVIVVAYHMRTGLAPSTLANGYLAVDFFFVLSGFVVGWAYEDKLRHGTLTFTGFARRRVLRLLPLVMVGAVLGAIQMLLFRYMGFSQVAPAKVLAALPLAMLALPVPWFDLPFVLDLPTWSLFYEFIASFAFALLAPRLSDRALRMLTGVLALLLIAIVAARGTFRWAGHLPKCRWR